MTTKTYDLTPEELEQKRLELEARIIEIVKAKRRAKRIMIWQVTKAVAFPFMVIIGFIGFIVFGALFAILGESFKKILK